MYETIWRIDVLQAGDELEIEQRGMKSAVRAVAALFCLTFAIYGASIYAFVIIVQQMGHEFGWSPMRTGGLVSAMWLTAPLALCVGPVTRRIGGWTLAGCGIALQAGALVGMTIVTDFGNLYLLRVLMGFGKVVTICTIPMLLTAWVKRGFATSMAIVWAGGSAGGLVMAPLAGWLVAGLGWRDAALITGGLIAASGALALFLLRPRGSPPTPEQPDPGDVAALGTLATLKSLSLTGMVAMFVSVVGIGIVGVGLISLQPTLFERAGMPSELAATLLGVSAASSFVGSASIGAMYDRVHPLACGIAVLFALSLGLISMHVLHGHPVPLLGFISSVGIGYALGAGESLWIILFRVQFGAIAFPVTYVLWFLAIQIGYGSGGWISGWAIDHLKGDSLLILLAFLYLPAAVAMVLLRSGRQRQPVISAV